jgi:hypothetical protein
MKILFVGHWLKSKLFGYLNLKFFEKFYLQFFLILREDHSLPQNIIQAITVGLRSLYQRIATTTSVYDFILLSNANKVISNVLETITNVTKNAYNFLKLCKIKEELRIEIRTFCVLQKAKQNYRQIYFNRAVSNNRSAVSLYMSFS